MKNRIRSRTLKYLAIMLSSTLVVNNAFAEDLGENSPRVDQTQPDKLSSDKPSSFKMWFAVPASYFLGFGSGQAIQGRDPLYWLGYTAADLVGFAFVLSTFGDCASSAL